MSELLTVKAVGMAMRVIAWAIGQARAFLRRWRRSEWAWEDRRVRVRTRDVNVSVTVGPHPPRRRTRRRRRRGRDSE